MKIPIWLRWSAVAMSAFLAGFYVSYASGYMKQASDVHMSGSKIKVLDEVLQQARAADATIDGSEIHPDLAGLRFRESALEKPAATPAQGQPPPTWMYSSKSAPISPPTTSDVPPPASQEFMAGSKSAVMISPPPPPPSPSKGNSKPAPPSKGQPYQGKGGPW